MSTTWIPGTIWHNEKAFRVWVNRSALDHGSGAIAPWNHVKNGHVTAEALMACMSGESYSFAHVYDGRVSRFGRDLGALSECFTPDAKGAA